MAHASPSTVRGRCRPWPAFARTTRQQLTRRVRRPLLASVFDQLTDVDAPFDFEGLAERRDSIDHGRVGTPAARFGRGNQACDHLPVAGNGWLPPAFRLVDKLGQSRLCLENTNLIHDLPSG